MAGQADFEADAHVPVFVRREPTRALDLGLRHHRARLHVRVHLVAGAVEEARIDEDHALAAGANALLQVHGRAAFLVHDADLQRVRGQAERLLDGGEQLDRQRDFRGPVVLRLHDVHAAGAAVAEPCPLPRRSCSAASVVITQSRNVSGIGWPAASVTASVVMCEPTWRTSSRLRPGSVERRAVRCGVLAVGSQAALHGRAALA